MKSQFSIFDFQFSMVTMINVSVIGAGTMGNGIAHVFAQNGFKVNLVDISQEQLDKAFSTISKNLDRQIAKAALTEDVKRLTLLNLTTSTSIAEGVKNAELVVEAATESIDLKLKIFQQLDELAPAD
ncbi:MAG TPA: 3-hydroxyacyl-CoA dehydrogenase NAD-binding domain-containing protein, partial [Segetibacter sp.]